MINRIGQDYLKSQKASEVFNPARRYDMQTGGINQDSKVVNRVGDNTVNHSLGRRVVGQNQGRGSVENREQRYFRRATGLETQTKKPRLGQTGHTGKVTLPVFDQKDRIQMSMEGKEELRMQKENEFDAFRYKNPINMQAFRQNLGMENNLHQIRSGDSLAHRLEAISMRTTGMGW